MKRLSFVILGILGVFMPLSQTRAIDFLFIDILSDAFENAYSLIHFAAGGNNYPGAFFVTNQKSLPVPQEIVMQGITVHCSKQLKGFYYNAQRGTRLWPMDDETKDSFPGYDLLTIEGGLFTTCTEDTKGNPGVYPYDIVGYIKYIRHDLPENYVVAGSKLDWKKNAYKGPYASTLGFFNNSKILGFIYDSFGNSGIGFIGGIGVVECYEDLLSDLNQKDGINVAFYLSGSDVRRTSKNPKCNGWVLSTGSVDNTQWTIDIKGGVNISEATSDVERQSLVGNVGDQALLTNADFANASTLLSLARKNASQLCRGLIPHNGTRLPQTSDEVICVDTAGSPFIIDLKNEGAEYEGKVIVVKQGDVILRGSMPYDGNSFDLLIENGNLLLENELIADELTFFDQFGYPTSTISITRGKYIKANLIVNGVVGGVNSASPDEIVQYLHKTYLHGRLSTLSTPLEPSEKRKLQLENIFGSVWLGKYGSLINIQTALKWRCLTNGFGNDQLTECNDESDRHIFSSLIVIKQNERSKLLGN